MRLFKEKSLEPSKHTHTSTHTPVLLRPTKILVPLLFLLFKIYLFIISFLAALDLRCCMGTFSNCGERGYSSLWCVGVSLQRVLLRSTGFSSCGTRALPPLLDCPWLQGPHHLSRTHYSFPSLPPWKRSPCFGEKHLQS